jgi:peptidoglycan/LPS O-acetylase OafA/YrhL
VAGWGALGVDLFFVLSGYLIANQWFGETTRGHPMSLSRFYVRRGFRIWPNYFFLVGLYLFVFPNLPDANMRPLWKFLTLTMNFGDHTGFPAPWSLCIEEHFYLVFPLTATYLLRRNDARTSITTVVFVILGGIAVRTLLWLHFAQIGFRPKQRPSVSIATSTSRLTRDWMA